MSYRGVRRPTGPRPQRDDIGLTPDPVFGPEGFVCLPSDCVSGMRWRPLPCREGTDRDYFFNLANSAVASMYSDGTMSVSGTGAPDGSR